LIKYPKKYRIFEYGEIKVICSNVKITCSTKFRLWVQKPKIIAKSRWCI